MIKNKVPVTVYRFKPGEEAKTHPLIRFDSGYEMSDQPGFEDSLIGFPDRYMLKKVEGKCDGFTMEGDLYLEDGDVIVEYADGTYGAMRGGTFDALYEEDKK